MTGLAPPRDADLIGAWELTSFEDIEDGVRSPGPLGDNPTGLLLYTADRHVAATMMSSTPAPGHTYMSYAGTWRRDGNRMIHHITVAPDPAWIGTDQERELEYAGDRIWLYGNSLVGPVRRRVLQWRRRRPGARARTTRKEHS